MTHEPPADSAFLSLPQRHTRLLRILGPAPAQSGAAVTPCTRLDSPNTVVAGVLGGLCGDDGTLIQPVEIILALDPATVTPNRQVPAASVVRALISLPACLKQVSTVPGFELLRDAVQEPRPIGPLLYCRHRRLVFEARSPQTAKKLAWGGEAAGGATGDIPVELVVWDGPAAGRDAAIYGSRGGRSALGVVLPFDQMILDQGAVAARAAEVSPADPAVAAEVSREHACSTCTEHDRCYPTGGGYSYASDRLVVVSALAAPLVVRPLGEWRISEAARIVGGMLASEVAVESGGGLGGDNELTAWRVQRAAVIDQTGPARLLIGETDGRGLIELARIKLALLADTLSQLDEFWRATERPHMQWTDDTVRCAWQPPGALPATAWGFRPILRKGGLQPDSPSTTVNGKPTPYPPVFSEATMLPAEVVEASRYFDEPRPTTVFIKKAVAESGGARVTVLLENLGVPWELFTPADTVVLKGPNWHALLAPLAERDKNDGSGLPMTGVVKGTVDRWKTGEQFDRCECRWLPRFGQAVDLHAAGLLLFETMFVHDGFRSDAYRAAFARERDELHRLLRGVPRDQREGTARRLLADRSEIDSPNALWSRRNLLFRGDERRTSRLDAFPPALWQSIITVGARMTTYVDGFSYCPDRSAAAPRLPSGMLLPLVELRGLLALLDDLLFGRSTPGTVIRDQLVPPRSGDAE